MSKTAHELRAELRSRADAQRIPVLQRFFKTAPGQYADGDLFIGIKVPQLRTICRECGSVAIPEAVKLLRSPVHEERLLALMLLVEAFRRGSPAEQRRIYELYIANTDFSNNWDRRLAGAANRRCMAPESEPSAAETAREIRFDLGTTHRDDRDFSLHRAW